MAKFITILDNTGRQSSLEVSSNKTIEVVGGLSHCLKFAPLTNQDADNLIAWLQQWKANNGNIPECRRCKIPMREGEALQNTLAGYPDFPGDRHAVTLSRTGPAEIIKCWKCPACGRSISK